MAFHDVNEGKTEISGRCLESLANTVDLSKHRVFLIDNNSCEATKALLVQFAEAHDCYIITNSDNLGTAEAINLAWKERRAGENCMKIDNDVFWYESGWLEKMEECIARDPSIGIVGLKRKDCWETPWHEDPQYKSIPMLLPHKPGEKWILVERCKHIMGTCQMYNSALLDKIGYLFQFGKYGYDDVLASYRSEIAQFINVHLSPIEIDHIDPGGTEYQSWKERHAGEHTQKVIELVTKYISGEKPIYYNPFK